MSDDTIVQEAIRRGKPIGHARARTLLAERDAALARITELESQLGQTHELLAILRDACRPAATLLFNLDMRGGLGQDTHRVIRETLTPLDAALAATKASE
jgi:hypothetical protein